MRIALLATGGTIACRQTPDGLSPALHAEELAKSISCRDGVTLLPVDVFSMDSSNIQPEEWTQLAHAVDRAMQTCDGVVITHGTDTMGYTAAALSYMLLGQMKPVILTGSQLPIGTLRTDPSPMPKSTSPALSKPPVRATPEHTSASTAS